MNVLGGHAEAFVVRDWIRYIFIQNVTSSGVFTSGCCCFFFQGRVLSCGMDDGQEQGNYEERLKEVFHSFDASGAGSLSPEELSELCQSLHLDETTPVLRALLQDQERLDARVRQLSLSTNVAR